MESSRVEWGSYGMDWLAGEGVLDLAALAAACVRHIWGRWVIGFCGFCGVGMLWLLLGRRDITEIIYSTELEDAVSQKLFARPPGLKEYAYTGSDAS